MDNGDDAFRNKKASGRHASRMKNPKRHDASRHVVDKSTAVAEAGTEARYVCESTNVCLSPPSFLIVKYFFLEV